MPRYGDTLRKRQLFFWRIWIKHVTQSDLPPKLGMDCMLEVDAALCKHLCGCWSPCVGLPQSHLSKCHQFSRYYQSTYNMSSCWRGLGSSFANYSSSIGHSEEPSMFDHAVKKKRPYFAKLIVMLSAFDIA